MKLFVMCLCLACLTLKSTAQSADSTRAVSLPAYVIWRMIAEVQQGRLCDSLQAQQAKELQKAKETIYSDSVALSRQGALLTLSEEKEALLVNTIGLRATQNKELRNDLRRQKRMTWAVGIASLLVILIIL